METRLGKQVERERGRRAVLWLAAGRDRSDCIGPVRLFHCHRVRHQAPACPGSRIADHDADSTRIPEITPPGICGKKIHRQGDRRWKIDLRGAHAPPRVPERALGLRSLRRPFPGPSLKRNSPPPCAPTSPSAENGKANGQAARGPSLSPHSQASEDAGAPRRGTPTPAHPGG